MCINLHTNCEISIDNQVVTYNKSDYPLNVCKRLAVKKQQKC